MSAAPPKKSFDVSGGGSFANAPCSPSLPFPPPALLGPVSDGRGGAGPPASRVRPCPVIWSDINRVPCRFSQVAAIKARHWLWSC